jgi:hypothetical protein
MLYHACHKDELETILAAGELDLRSTWSLRLPKHGLWKAPGVWTGLNYFGSGNQYGPFLLEFPISVLNGKNFMVFRRTSGRERYFFVQYEARIPIYSFGKKLWRRVDPNHYFTNAKQGAIWDIVLTHPIAIENVVIRPVEHPKCIPKKCSGKSRPANLRTLQAIIANEFQDFLACSTEYQEFSQRYPDASGLQIKLPYPDGE